MVDSQVTSIEINKDIASITPTEDDVLGKFPVSTSGPHVLSESEAESDERDEEGTAIRHVSENMGIQVESLISNELAKMAPKDREQVYFDIHGVSNPIQESPDLLEASLFKLHEEIDLLLQEEPTDMKAYQMALDQNTAYVQNRDFELRFLRADRFDAKLAATRLRKHFQIKLDLFGPSKLGKQILQADLDEYVVDAESDDRFGSRSLYDGFKQVLPLRDRTGRLVYVDMAQNVKFEDSVPLQTRWRRKFYSAMVASEDVETQRKGAIGILYAVDEPHPRYDLKYIKGNMTLMEGLPLRFEAVHLCHNNTLVWAPMIVMYQMMAHVFQQVRSRVHYGNHQECLFKLQTFGIPVSVMPLSSDFQRVTTDQNAKIWQQRRLYEEQTFGDNKNNDLTTITTTTKETKDEEDEVTTPELVRMITPPGPASEAAKTLSTTANDNILFPAQFDVLLGRGKGFHDHMGNLRLRSMIEELKTKYDDSPRDDKKQMTLDILQNIQVDLGGRFLKQSKTGWVIVDDEEARLKISHTFRNIAKTITSKKNKKKKKVETTATTNDCCGEAAKDASISKRVRSETFGREFYSLE